MARTFPTMSVEGRGSAITGASVTLPAALTNDADTTAEINKRGFAFGSVYNQSGGSVTITYYGCVATGGEAAAVLDQDGVAVTQTVADEKMAELPSALAGIPFLMPVVASGTPTLYFHFER